MLAMKVVRAGVIAGPYADLSPDLGNFVEITEPDAGEKMAPFVQCKFADWTLGIVCVPDQYSVSSACHSHTRATVARA
jgi:hypothetical protein